ncbi:hypothetical protein R1flu_000110 [Riccia fluitans]|uniref:Uncharacterized protein n=1 Tax=Riccia fluitans TaxID=41844 RepID=A0ABD1XZJ1_9MARC
MCRVRLSRWKFASVGEPFARSGDRFASIGEGSMTAGLGKLAAYLLIYDQARSVLGIIEKHFPRAFQRDQARLILSYRLAGAPQNVSG